MIKDNVVITGNSIHIKTGTVVCYVPKLNEQGDPLRDAKGNILEMKKLGYVVVGEQGTITGAPLSVSTQYLEKKMGDADYHLPGSTIDVVPVLVTKYNTIGWFPLNNVQVVE